MALTTSLVRHYYNAILKREPSHREVQLWTEPASGKRTKKDLAAALLVQATEVRSIARLYAGVLGRLPESLTGLPYEVDGLAYWTGTLRAFRAKHAGIAYRDALAYVVEDWFSSPEYLRRFGENISVEDYAVKLCKMILARSPMKSELEEWINIAEQPQSGRAKLAVALAEMQECKNKLNETIDELLLAQAEKSNPDLSREPE